MGNAPPIDLPSPNGIIDSEATARTDRVGVETVPTPTAPDIDPNFEFSPDRFSFDFEEFLERGALDDVFGISPDSKSTATPDPVYDGGKWEAVKLSGGLINVTLRVSSRCRDGEPERDQRSVVMKYAPPFVAAMGEAAPFGTFRQVIEYRALSLITSTTSITAAEAAYGVSIPRVLRFFKDERVLVLQDLGEWMIPLESWMYPSAASTTMSPPSIEMCSSVGTRLGNFIASVHCDATLLSRSQALTEDGKPWFENPDAKDLMRVKAVGRVLPILQAHFGPGADRNEKIAEIISQDFEQSFLDAPHPSLPSPPSTAVAKSMFSVGDLWVGSFLVDASPGPHSSSDPNLDENTQVKVGLIDWEFSSPARIGQDIVQLTAWLYMYSALPDPGVGTSHGIDNEDGAGEEVEWRSAAGSLLRALLGAYARKVKGYPDYAWFVDEEYDQCRFKKERLAAIRTVWVLFGREVICGVVGLKFKFAGFFAADSGGDEEMKAWQRGMLQVGCWYVSMAGEKSDDEFEEIVRGESVLKRIYTISKNSQ